jgi:2-polyprenyl-3-methyl-5-hydroxy-6-metoxy-1,4-benzoquinol methylase
MEKNVHFYNQAYLQGGIYHMHYTDSPYYAIWMRALEIIREINNPEIIEIGCGSGQFANLLFDHGIDQYRGIDFSEEAIRLAKRTNDRFADKFSVDNAYTSQIFQSRYNTVILFEVLEHLLEDITVINRARAGSKVFFSVPNFDSESHVRFFRHQNDIVNRYGDFLKIDDIFSFRISKRNALFLVNSIKL